MKFAICQINSQIGDFENNSNKIINYIKLATEQKCDLIIFPELCISGYPPMDLLDNPEFIDHNYNALNKILKHTVNSDNYVILGSITRLNNQLFNSALVLHKGNIIFQQNKTLLPNYDVFDEKRYFTPNKKFSLFQINNFKIGILICEDIWYDEFKNYKINPINKIKKLKPDLVVVISASPFEKEKIEKRLTICHNNFVKSKIPIIYVNSIGAQDELIFDGASFYLNNDNIFICKQFEEDFAIFDLNQKINNYKKVPLIEQIHSALILGIKDYFLKCKFNKTIIGISGGIDSAVVASLAVRALGNNNVIGLILPSKYTSQASIDDAIKLSRNLEIEYFIISINKLFSLYLDELSEYFKNREFDITEENIQSRIRGNLLMAFANKFNALVLATGNKSELSMGYCTLYGDLIGGLAVIGDLLKREIYELARYINKEKEIIPENIFLKAPSAELKYNQKDEDTLPPYKILDAVLYYHFELGLTKNDIINKYNFDENIVNEIFHKLYRQEYKRKQAPITLKISRKNFGIGRRIPITNKFYFLNKK
ncbi:MAG TPA: NAD+ synthase [bacterium]|nr:NAD+ synthase [bacterium]HOL47947.1 NAD+ synthase [bacterium]HPQ19306.1 NAD+ synthase [bacterium]